MMMYINNKTPSLNILLQFYSLLIMMMMTMMENNASVFVFAHIHDYEFWTADLRGLPPSDSNERQRHQRHLDVQDDNNMGTDTLAGSIPSSLIHDRHRFLSDNMGSVTVAFCTGVQGGRCLDSRRRKRRFLSDIQVNNTFLKWDLFGLPMNCIDCKIGIFNTNECNKDVIINSQYLYNNTWYDFNLMNPWTNVTFDTDSNGHSIGNHTFDHQLNETNFVGNVAVLGDSYGNPIGCGIFSEASEDEDNEEDDPSVATKATTSVLGVLMVMTITIISTTMIGF